MNSEDMFEKLKDAAGTIEVVHQMLNKTVEEAGKSDTDQNRPDEMYMSFNSKDFLTMKDVLDKDFRDKDIWVYWSGGFDSTAILLSLCKTFPDKTINTFSIEHECVGSGKADRAARIRIRKELRKRGYKISSHDVKIDNYYGAGYGLSQPVIWFSQIGHIIGQAGVICFGYIRGDDFWHYQEAAKLILRGYNMFKDVNTEETKILMPLEWKEKKDIIKYLRKNNLDTLCNYCEGNQNDELGEEEPCHKCHSCKVHDEAIRELEEIEKAEKVLDKKE